MSRLERTLSFFGIALKYDPRPSDRVTNITLVIFCSLLVLLPFLGTYDSATNDVKIARVTLPAMCLSRACFNTDCPGCGLTRSFISLVHGKLAASMKLHRLAPVLYCFFLFQIFFRAWSIRAPNSTQLPKLQLFNHYLALILIVSLLSNWAIGTVFHLGN